MFDEYLTASLDGLPLRPHGHVALQPRQPSSGSTSAQDLLTRFHTESVLGEYLNLAATLVAIPICFAAAVLLLPLPLPASGLSKAHQSLSLLQYQRRRLQETERHFLGCLTSASLMIFAAAGLHVNQAPRLAQPKPYWSTRYLFVDNAVADPDAEVHRWVRWQRAQCSCSFGSTVAAGPFKHINRPSAQQVSMTPRAV